MENSNRAKPIIAMSSAFLYRRSLETNLRIVREAGFQHVELFITHNVVPRPYEEIRNAINESGLNVASFHLPIPFRYNLDWPNLETSIARGLKWSESFDAEWVISHPLIVPADADEELHEAILARYKRILTAARKLENSDKLLIENMPRLGEGRPIRNLFQYPEMFLEILNEFGFGMTFDTTHWGSFNLDVTAGFRPFMEYVKNIHISDFKDGVEHIVPGDGDIDLGGFIDELASHDYSGQLTIELDFTTRGRNEGRDEHGVLKDLVNCREWLEKAFSIG